jgi:two-component system OmpR family sensor kinase
MTRRAPSRAALRAEIVARDTFLARVSEGLEARVAALRGALDDGSPAGAAHAALDDLAGFSRELGLITRADAVVTRGGREPLDLAGAIRALVEAHRDRLARGGRAVELVVTGTVPVACAHDDVETVFAELVSNAVKYGDGPIAIRVEATRSCARLTIRDGGPGIAPALRRRVLRKFVRGGAARARPGFGVGLWLVRKIARGYGGDLRLQDGAVCVTLPSIR